MTEKGEDILGLGSEQKRPARIAIFASGAGSNAQKIIECSQTVYKDIFSVALVACNKPSAGVFSIAQKNGIATLTIDKEVFFRGNGYADELKATGIDFIVLAGFLLKVPNLLINAYSGKVVNIHPALLPKYGGKGMYGKNVHEAVIAGGETESGITIHWVDEQYDHGQIIFQASCPVLPNDTAETLAEKIHALEHAHYVQQIAELLKKIAV